MATKNNSSLALGVTVLGLGILAVGAAFIARNQKVKNECTEGQKRCSPTSPNIIQGCVGGSFETAEICPNGCENGVCKDGGSVCQENQAFCVGNVRNVCRNGEFIAEDCENGCDIGTGSCSSLPPAECTNGDTRCVGDDFEECISGQYEFIQRCPNGCENGSCVETICSPGETQCSNNVQTVCSSDGKRFESPSSCQYGCDGNECGLPQIICTPGDKACQGNFAVECNQFGTEYITSECLFCCQDGECTACCDGDTKCTGPDTISTCQNGQWVPAGRCSSGICNNPTGQCL